MSIHRASLSIQSSPRNIFAVLTEPEFVKRWQFNKTLSTHWKVGEEIKFTTEYGEKKLEQWGSVLEFVPEQLIKYTLFTPKPGLEDMSGNYATTTYVLTRESNGTHIELIQEDPHTEFFQPMSLMPILAVLKKTAEDLFPNHQ